jgi:hypothetical protein
MEVERRFLNLDTKEGDFVDHRKSTPPGFNHYYNKNLKKYTCK